MPVTLCLETIGIFCCLLHSLRSFSKQQKTPPVQGTFPLGLIKIGYRNNIEI